MKKSILAAGISLLLVFPGAAAEPTTLNGLMGKRAAAPLPNGLLPPII